MGLWRDQILPRGVNKGLDNPDCNAHRERAAAGLHGTVLELGFGSGLNLPWLPAAVECVLAVDPAKVGRKLGAERIAACPARVEFIAPDAEVLPLDDASVDSALVTWSLCTIPDVGRALGEVRRVLRPGGALHFVEHGRSTDAGVARWQDRLDWLQAFACGGCHLNRRIDELVAAAGFDIERLDTHYLPKGPRILTFTYEGVARRGEGVARRG